MDDQLRRLEQRVHHLERRLDALTPPPYPPPTDIPPRRQPAPGPRTAAPTRPLAPDVIPVRSSLSEERVIGTWFPRIGALALVLGAGFGFKYAVDQGFIGPALRVLVGLIVGASLLVGGEAARRRSWAGFGQAITGGGIGLLYLTTWAAWHLYGYVSAEVAWVLLASVSALGVAVALRHDGEALGIVAILGAFWSPFATSMYLTSAGTTHAYVLAIDVGVIALTFARPWRVITKIAFTSTWLVLNVVGGSEYEAIAAASATFVLFALPPYLRTIARREPALRTDAVAMIANGFVYYVVVASRIVEATLDVEAVGWFTLVMGAAYLGGTLIVHKIPGARIVAATAMSMSLFFFTIWVFFAVDFDLAQVALIWTVEALALFLIGRHLGEFVATTAAGIVFLGSLVLHLVPGAIEQGQGLTTAIGRVTFAAQIATLFAFVYLTEQTSSNERSQRAVATIGAHALTLLWLSVETTASVGSEPSLAPGDPDQFALSALWAIYACGLLALGIGIRSSICRILSVSLFAVTLAKMSIVDLWLLPTGQRLVGFAGIGLLLIVCSLMYHRFKTFLLDPDAPADAA